jgi:hypothetical protein
MVKVRLPSIELLVDLEHGPGLELTSENPCPVCKGKAWRAFEPGRLGLVPDTGALTPLVDYESELSANKKGWACCVDVCLKCGTAICV